MPNPADKSFEILKIMKKIVHMMFFCNESWCSQRNIKSGKEDDREIFINNLIKKSKFKI